ncbi:MAG: hypothetical protein GOVbin2513_33 [Prokaryotic dsDNA virus sp.]|nr:MAG: hypothetical protein GOVbin2513_33 [Prokaryotic dsDNA virus sp.]|tara:strand:- start:10408 stop:10818 length:411 start_codon:yes stop_codon:yes gene_type:complete
MKKTELLEFMEKEQLIRVVNSMIDKNKNLENQLKESESLTLTRCSRIKNLELIVSDKNKELEEWKERSFDNLSTLESIAREVNKSTIMFKDVEQKENSINSLITIQNCNNIIYRLQDRFNMNDDGLFICNATKKPF